MAYTTIDDPSAHNQGLVHIGTDSAHKISYDGHADYIPDIFFVKDFNGSSAPEHTDSVATDGTNNGIRTSQEHSTYGRRREIQVITQLESDGYTVTGVGQVNGDGHEYMALTWNCGSTATITTFGNNITSVSASGNAPAYSYTVNTTAKQSIAFWEGTGVSGLEIPHHLGVKPTFAMIRKMGEGTYDQTNYYDAGPFSFYKDQTADGRADGVNGNDVGGGWYYAPSNTGPSSSGYFSAAPDSTKHTLGTHGYLNTDNYDFVCYSFSDIQGYFKQGFYEGNGSADGPFVYTGFEPEILLINPQDDGTNPSSHGNLGYIAGSGYYGGHYWFVNGMTTNGFNPHDKTWNWGNSNRMDDYDQNALDIYSNGFKIRAPGTDSADGWQAGNQVDKTVWYAAWAKYPLVTSGGVPNTAV